MLVSTNTNVSSDFIHNFIHNKKKIIHLKKNKNTLSCVSSFIQTQYIVFLWENADRIDNDQRLVIITQLRLTDE